MDVIILAKDFRLSVHKTACFPVSFILWITFLVPHDGHRRGWRVEEKIKIEREGVRGRWMYNGPLWSIERVVYVTCDPFMVHTHAHVLVNTHSHTWPKWYICVIGDYTNICLFLLEWTCGRCLDQQGCKNCMFFFYIDLHVYVYFLCFYLCDGGKFYSPYVDLHLP